MEHCQNPIKKKNRTSLQVDSFLYCMGNKIKSFFNGLALSDEDTKNYQKVSEAF